MKCYIHPDIDAVGTCTSCGKTVCSICAMDVGGKVVCKQCAEKMAATAAAAAAATASTPSPGPTASYAPSSSQKNPILGLIASLIVPGVGQALNGQIKKGIILFVLMVIAWIVGAGIFIAVTVVSMGFGFCCGLVGYLIPVAVHLYAAYEAYSTAKKINMGEFTKDWLS